MNINVVATDSHGNPVTGLTKEDFLVLDGGKPQTISFFDPVRNEAGTPSPLPPNTYTNQLATRGATPAAIAILFDTLNSRWSSQGYGLGHVRNFLRQIRPEDRVGIYVLGTNYLGTDDLKVIHDFDCDSSDLVEAMHRYDEHAGTRPQETKTDTTGIAELDHFLLGKENRVLPWLEPDVVKDAGGAYQEYELEEALRTSLGYLQVIGRHLESSPGRKSLVWITDGIPGVQLCRDEFHTALEESGRFRPDNRDKTDQVDVATKPEDRAYQGLTTCDAVAIMVRLLNDNQNGISVYPVSAEGLQTFDLQWQRQIQASMLPHVQPMTNSLANPANHNAMLELAARTGGRAYMDRNDLETGLRHALNDLRFTYELAYYPDHDDWKGEWRKIQVKVKRPGVTVLTRSGYFAFPEPRLLAAKARKELLEEVAASPLEATGIPITVKLTSLDGETSPAAGAQVDLNAQKLFTNQIAGNWTSDLEVLFFQLTEKNVILDVTTQTLNLALQQAEYEQALKRGINTIQELKLKPSASVLYIIVHDKKTDAVGSVRIPLQEAIAKLREQPLPAVTTH